MSTKILFSTLLLAPAMASASSGFQSTGKPAWIHCHRPKGELSLEADEQNKTFQLALVIDGTTKLIEINSITAQKASSTPHVAITSFTYEDPSKNFITVDASFEQPHWFPPSEGCMMTRNTDADCIPVHHAGEWGTTLTDYVSVGFTPAGDGQYLLNMLDLKAYGIEGDSLLGENAVCSGTLL